MVESETIDGKVYCCKYFGKIFIMPKQCNWENVNDPYMKEGILYVISHIPCNNVQIRHLEIVFKPPVCESEKGTIGLRYMLYGEKEELEKFCNRSKQQQENMKNLRIASSC